MWTKKMALEEALRGEGCLGRARDDEPVFIIVGDDVTMPRVLEFWAEEVERVGGGPRSKTTEARAFAGEVREWQSDNEYRVKIPD